MREEEVGRPVEIDILSKVEGDALEAGMRAGCRTFGMKPGDQYTADGLVKLVALQDAIRAVIAAYRGSA